MMYVKHVRAVIPGYNFEGRLEETIPSVQKNIGINAVARFAGDRSYKDQTTQLRNALIESLKDAELCHVAHHLHITTFPSFAYEYYLREVRDHYELPQDLATWSIQQGCNGLLNALDLAGELLSYGDVLITVENNMVPSSSGHYPSPENHDWNEWLWPAIFGEAVGAIVVSHSPENARFRLHNHWQRTISVDGRVHPVDEGKIYIRAKEVSQTFSENVPVIAEMTLGAAERCDTLLIHESNPILTKRVFEDICQRRRKEFNTYSISAEVGTLAGVSTFSLLDLAQDDDNVVCVLIGEGGGTIRGGGIHLVNCRQSQNCQPTCQTKNPCSVREV